jgi:hypothetical protein
VDIQDATGALINVSGGESMTVSEAELVAAEIHKSFLVLNYFLLPIEEGNSFLGVKTK